MNFTQKQNGKFLTSGERITKKSAMDVRADVLLRRGRRVRLMVV
jgi:hypothetical protein